MRRRKENAPFSLFAFQDAITSVCGVVVLITLILALELTRRATEDETSNQRDVRRVQETQYEIALLRAEIKTLSEELRSDEATFATTPKGSKPEARDALKNARQQLEKAQKENSRLQDEQKDALALQEEIAKLKEEYESLLKEQNDASEAVAKAKESAEKTRRNAAENTSEFYVFPENGREEPWFVDLSKDRLLVVGSSDSERRQKFSDVESFLNWAKKRSRREEYFVLIARPSGAENFERVFDKLQTMDFRIGVELIGENKQLQFITKRSAGNGQ